MFSFSSPTHKESVPRLLAAPPQFSLRRSDGRTRQDRCLLPIAANTFYPFSEADTFCLGVISLSLSSSMAGL